MIGRLPPLPRWSLRDPYCLLPTSQPAFCKPTTPGPLCRGRPPSRDTPKSRDCRAQAPSTGAGPEQAARVLRLLSPSPTRRLRRGWGEGDPYLSGLFPGPGAAQLQEPMTVRGPGPSPGSRGADPGKGAGDPGCSSLVPCSSPGAWPGPDSASARPCAPPHTRAHTHSHSLARSHTRTPLPPPPLFISSSCLGTQEKPRTAPAPRSLRARPAPRGPRLRYGDGARQFPE